MLCVFSCWCTDSTVSMGTNHYQPIRQSSWILFFVIKTKLQIDVASLTLSPLTKFLQCNIQNGPAKLKRIKASGHLIVFDFRNHGIRNSVLGVMIQSRLTIFRVIPDNFGVYTCQAENDYGVQSSIINLRGISK